MMTENDDVTRAVWNTALAGVFAGLGATPEEADTCAWMLGAEEVASSPGGVMTQCMTALAALRSGSETGDGGDDNADR